MTFVYCGDSWKTSKNYRQPGSGEYTVNNSFCNQKEPCSYQRPVTSLKKKHNQSNTVGNELSQIQFKQWLNQGIFFKDNQMKGRQYKNQRLKKGKLYGSVTSILKKNEEQISNKNYGDCGLKIKNSKKQKNQWGNTKILELMNQHNKSTQASPQPTKKTAKAQFLLKTNIQAYKARQKIQNDPKQLQSWFQVMKKKSENRCSLKNMNREISAKHRIRQMNSHNYTKAQGFSQAAATTEQNLELYPSNICKSSSKDGKFYASSQSISDQRFLAKDDSLPTGCTENISQESVQYIENATPGPGSYNYSSSAIKIAKKGKVQKFGVTMDRFKLQQKVIQPQTAISLTFPEFKVVSHASQQRVGFGRTKLGQRQQRPIHNGVFYDDQNNIENKIKKLHQKAENEKIGFSSCKQRFIYEKQKQIQVLLSESEHNNAEIDQIEMDSSKMPMNIFLSKVKREFPVNYSTEDVDFAGQNFNCLGAKLKKQKQFYQDYEMKPAAFIFKQQRFKYAHQPQHEEIKQELKIQKLKQLKQKKEAANKKEQKGYTFCKQQFLRNSQQQQYQQPAAKNKFHYAPKCRKSPKKVVD